MSAAPVIVTLATNVSPMFCWDVEKLKMLVPSTAFTIATVPESALVAVPAFISRIEGFASTANKIKLNIIFNLFFSILLDRNDAMFFLISRISNRQSFRWSLFDFTLCIRTVLKSYRTLLLRKGKLEYSVAASYHRIIEATMPGSKARKTVGVKDFQNNNVNDRHIRVVAVA